MSEEPKRLTPIKAIRAKCMDCSGGSFLEVRECPCTGCPLYPYRMGHRPPKMNLQDEAEEILIEEDNGEN